MTTPRSILITGCSSGIGYHCALSLHERGWRVFATARRDADIEALTTLGLEALRLDVADTDSIEEAVAAVLEHTGGRLDALFNNAGYGQPGAVEDLPADALRAQFETNVIGAQQLIRAVLPAMRTRGHGRIVNHSSVLGIVALPYRGAYNASKFALEGLTDTLRQELAVTAPGIGVSLIETGPVRSQFRANAYRMYQRYIDASTSAHRDIYEAVERRLAGSGDAPFTRGPEAVCDKLVHALEAPRPRARYRVTVPTQLFGLLRRILPTRGLDAALLRSTAAERR
ncbi:SDR family NAD(P)-dependent oxidoreductase [Arhodomonas sp. AD133]|uniref:SDR family NAD(P)-dependent oxidoreductase n=1 Tax=Arhodomonas sp. AD133 TaxID=3415009 RepID=UPI003EB798A3